MKSIFSLIFALSLFQILSPNISYSQEKLSIKVIDRETLELIEGASVQVLNAKDSVLLQNRTSKDGTLNLGSLNTSAVFLNIGFLGYATQKLSLNDISKTEVLTVRLEKASINLDVIDIVAAPIAQIKGDTTEFSAHNFKTEPYADSDALIKQMPGVVIDENGNVEAHGSQVTKILVDNKEFFTTDPRLALKNLPADIVDKIQIIDEKSEQANFTGFDDGNRNKVINIVTKPDKRTGYFGNINTGLGSLDRYAVQGNVSYFTGNDRLSISAISNNVNQRNFGMGDGAGQVMIVGRGSVGGRNSGGGGGGGNSGIPGNSISNTISANYNKSFLDNALQFNADYSFNTSNSLVRNITNRETLLGHNANQLLQSSSENDRENSSHRTSFNVKWDIDSLQTITFRPNFSYQTTQNNSTSLSNTLENSGEPINNSNRNQDSENVNYNLSGNLNYRLKLNKPGRTFSANLSFNSNSSEGVSQNFSLNEYYENYLLGRIDTTNLLNQTETLGNGFNARITYTEPLLDNHRIQLNYGFRNNSNFSNRETLNGLAETGQFEELNEQLSNTFNNDFLYHSGGITYQFTQEKFNIDLGLDYQNSYSKNFKVFPEEMLATRSFDSFLPNAVFNYRVTRDNNLRFQYNTSTNAPSISQLQDVVNNENPLNISTGNSDLQQEFQHRFNLTYNFVNRTLGSNLDVGLSASFSNNKIVNSTYNAMADTLILPGVLLGKGGQFTKPVNVDGYYTMASHISWGAPIQPLKINLNLRTNAHLTHNIGFLNNQLTESDSYGLSQSVGINSRINEKIIFGLNYSANYSVSNTSLDVGNSYHYFNQNLGGNVTYTFWKGVRVNSSVSYQNNSGLTQGYNQSFVLWNASLGKKLFNQQQGEISLSVNDILNKNMSINRTVNEMYITDTSSNTLRQYFMLSFTYNLRKFGAGFGNSNQSTRRGGRA